jgi:hypothetical protein
LLAAALLAPAAADAVVPLTLSAGGAQPGVAVDAAGAANVAWVDAVAVGDSQPLHFCKVQRTGMGCEGGTPKTLQVPGVAAGPTWVSVSGSRVLIVLPRSGGSVPNFDGVYSVVSPDGGATFGIPHYVGRSAAKSVVFGPGDTFSSIGEKSLQDPFENIASTAESDEAGFADLATPEYNDGVIGLDNGQPFAIVSLSATNYAWRRYDGSGSVNDVANWTAPVAMPAMGYAKVAGGPLGTFAGGNDTTGTIVRKFDGGGFGPAVVIGPASTVSWFAQDAGSRLQAMFVQSVDGKEQLVHAVSDNGRVWRTGVLTEATTPDDTAFNGLNFAVAADHTGAAVWAARSQAIQLAFSGPDVPPPGATPTPSPTPTAGPGPPLKKSARLKTTGSIKLGKGKVVRVTLTFTLQLPAGVSRTSGCSGRISVDLLRKTRSIATRSIPVGSACTAQLTGTFKKSQIGKVKSLKVRVSFGGNAALRSSTQQSAVPISGRGH